jgi:hypothetical protein
MYFAMKSTQTDPRSGEAINRHLIMSRSGFGAWKKDVIFVASKVLKQGT